MSCIQLAMSDAIFTRIMAWQTTNEAQDKFKKKFQSSDKTRQMQVINLKREFEVFKMKDDEIVRQYTKRLMKVMNKIKLLGDEHLQIYFY